MRDKGFKIPNLSATQLEELIPQSPILVGYRGSIAHGMYVPSTEPNSIDDKDVMAVCIPKMEYYLAFDSCGFGIRGVHEKWIGEYDCVSYELKKYVSLLVKANPNVLALLWNEPQYQIYATAEGKMLLEHRSLFVSKKIYHAFTGYAYGQLHRMTNMAFEGYMGEKRKGLVAKHGYDTKNAAHALRLLRMGIEYLNEGTLYVDRSKKDGPQLLEIKRGEWTLEQVKTEADRLMKAAEEVYLKSTLPAEVNMEAVNELMVKMLRFK